MALLHGSEISDSFQEIIGADGWLMVAGFGSLLSERSARSTFPDLRNFRVAKIYGYRRVFAHVAPIFFERGIANAETGEISSVSVEPTDLHSELIVTCFEFEATPEAIEAFIEREHEFKFIAVQPYTLEGVAFPCMAVICSAWNDEDYKKARCPKEMFEQKYVRLGIERVYRDDIFPCRVYLRHCVLAAKKLEPNAVLENFLDASFLGDRATTIREYLNRNPDILSVEPPPEISERYCG